ncbi:MAG: hypothetical protein HYU66_05390, partial [Armatimonadetes bacterium]|nr:hypothetical protein [Armatimonadota bacterium]
MTRRAVALGALFMVVLAVAIPYSDLELNGTWLAACHLPVGAFFLLLVLLLLNGVVVKVGRATFRSPLPDPGDGAPRRGVLAKLALRPGEILTVYAMMLVGSGIPSFGLTAYLIPTLAGCGYFTTPENHWATWFYRFIPQWFVPFDLSQVASSPVTGKPWPYHWVPGRFQPRGPELVKQFYEGLHGSQPIPWEPWVVPLAAWTILALFFFAACYGLSVFLRRQWVEGERLTFPLVQLPLALTQVGEDGVPPFVRQPAVWMGFCIPQLVHLVNGLHQYYPAVPRIKLLYDLGNVFTSPPWNQLGIFWVWIHFSVIGLTFLLPADFSFSLWFFYLVFKLEGACIVWLGHPIRSMPYYPTQRYAALQMLGAFVVLTGYMLYTARPYLRGVWATIRRRAGALDDANEPLGYRRAAVVLGLGVAGAAAMLALAGMPPLLAALVVLLTMLPILVLTRMISEGGLIFIQAPFQPSDMMLTGLAPSVLGPRNLTILAFYERIFALDVRACLQPSLLDAFRLSDGPPIPRRALTPALWLSILLAIAVSYTATLYVAYRYGAVTQSGWFMIGSPQQPFNQLVNYVSQPQAAHPGDVGTVALGALVMLAMCIARNRFAGFMLHPLGYAMGPSWPLIQL